MCGICGSFALTPNVPLVEARVRRMMSALVHRGPDDEGIATHPRAIFGFRRLAILDLSAHGNQPRRVGPITSVMNGEIYNFQTLRRELLAKGVPLESTGDAELIPHLYLEHGDAFLRRLDGMFALALFDERDGGRLLLARDRLGKKPLYFRDDGGRVDFASEPKSLLASDASSIVPDRAALSQFLEFGVVPGVTSIFPGLRRVPPGAACRFDVDGLRMERYWTPPKRTAVEQSVGAWKESIFSALCRAVERRLQADVPLGIFLSGGIDSGLILAAAREVTAAPPRTFTIGFHDPRYDERDLAAATAAHFGVEHSVQVATPNPIEALTRVGGVFDEPFGDPSAYPTLLVSRLAREEVTVALSGDGGDEAFAGYRRHRAVQLASTVARWIPLAVRRGVAARAGEVANGVAGRSRMGGARRFIAALGLPAAERNVYWGSYFRGEVRRQFLHPELLEQTSSVAPEKGGDRLRSPLRRVLDRDLTHYLPDDLLVKTDLASMACSLEVRAPYLDPELLGVAAELPDPLLVGKGETKHLLREIARDRLPLQVANARKRGFGVPLADWLRRELHPVATEYLATERFDRRKILRPGEGGRLLARHLSGKEDWSSYLWLLMVAEEWQRRFVDRETRG